RTSHEDAADRHAERDGWQGEIAEGARQGPPVPREERVDGIEPGDGARLGEGGDAPAGGEPAQLHGAEELEHDPQPEDRRRIEKDAEDPAADIERRVPEP